MWLYLPNTLKKKKQSIGINLQLGIKFIPITLTPSLPKPYSLLATSLSTTVPAGGGETPLPLPPTQSGS